MPLIKSSQITFEKKKKTTTFTCVKGIGNREKSSFAEVVQTKTLVGKGLGEME